MSIERVQRFLAEHAPETAVTVLTKNTATVALAAEAFGVESGQIAKTLSFRVNDGVVLLVMAGTARIDNKKYKQFFGVKARMLPTEGGGGADRLSARRRLPLCRTGSGENLLRSQPVQLR